MNISTVKLIGYRLRKYGYKNLKEYYESDRWKEKKDEFKRSNKNVSCSCCGRVSLHLDIHHKSYKSLCDENLDQLCYTCRKCHVEIHDLAKKKSLSIRIATKKVQRRLSGKRLKMKKRGRRKIDQLRSMDSNCLKGIARTKSAMKSVDLNIYQPSPVTIISPDGNKVVHALPQREIPKKPIKKVNLPEPKSAPHRKKKKKTRLKYTNEEIAKIAFGN